MTDFMSFMNLNMIISLVLFALSIMIPLFVYIFEGYSFKSHEVPGILITYALFFNVGCLFFTGFMGQFLYGAEIAQGIGWSWSPFQYELAFSELGLAILGLISPIFHKEFWLATIIASVVWLLGGAGLHLYYLYVVGNQAIMQASFVIGWNLFIAVWLLMLYGAYCAFEYTAHHKLDSE